MTKNTSLNESSYAEQDAKMTAWRNGTRNERVTAITSKDKLETDFDICLNRKYYGEAKQIYNQAVSVYKSFGKSRQCVFIDPRDSCFEMYMIRHQFRRVVEMTLDTHWQDMVGRSAGLIANHVWADEKIKLSIDAVRSYLSEIDLQMVFDPSATAPEMYRWRMIDKLLYTINLSKILNIDTYVICTFPRYLAITLAILLMTKQNKFAKAIVSIFNPQSGSVRIAGVESMVKQVCNDPDMVREIDKKYKEFRSGSVASARTTESLAENFLSSQEIDDYREKIRRNAGGYGVRMQDNGKFCIDLVPESEKDRLVQTLSREKYVKWVRAYETGKYDFRRLDWNLIRGVPKKYWRVCGEIELPAKSQALDSASQK